MTTDFEAFVEREQINLLRLAFLLTGNEADAGDLVQDCLTRAYAQWDRVGSADVVGAYVRTMVINTWRSRWRRLRIREITRPEVTPPGRSGSFDDAVADAELVWAECLKLPRRQQIAVVMRFYEDLSYAEIGRITGWSEATARSHVFRGLKRMRRSLGEEES